MTFGAECLEVVEVVRTTSCDVEDVVYFQTLGATALNTLVTVTRQDSSPSRGRDMRGIAVSPHWFFSLASENVKHPVGRGGVRGAWGLHHPAFFPGVGVAWLG